MAHMGFRGFIVTNRGSANGQENASPELQEPTAVGLRFWFRSGLVSMVWV